MHLFVSLTQRLGTRARETGSGTEETSRGSRHTPQTLVPHRDEGDRKGGSQSYVSKED